MCTQLCLRDRYAEGAGKTSVPVVVYVRAEEENGSMISGEDGDTETWGVCNSVAGALEKGCEERRRIAWVMVG